MRLSSIRTCCTIISRIQKKKKIRWIKKNYAWGSRRRCVSSPVVILVEAVVVVILEIGWCYGSGGPSGAVWWWPYMYFLWRLGAMVEVAVVDEDKVQNQHAAKINRVTCGRSLNELVRKKNEKESWQFSSLSRHHGCHHASKWSTNGSCCAWNGATLGPR